MCKIHMDGNNSLVMTTKSGTQLFFNEETGKFSSENKKDILDALTQDMENVQNDPKAALMAYNLGVAIVALGWE